MSNKKRDLKQIKDTILHLTKLVEELELKETSSASEYRSGDIVRILSTGKIGNKGDVANVIKVKGSRVELICRGKKTHRLLKNIRRI